MDYLRMARLEAGRFVEAASRVPPTAEIPTCPGWTAGQLVEHVVGLSHGVAWYVRSGHPAPPTSVELADWFAPRGLDELAKVNEVLAAADPDTNCWTVWPADSALEF